MSDTSTTLHGVQVLVCAPDGKKLSCERDALDLIGEAMQQGIEWVLVPVERLEKDGGWHSAFFLTKGLSSFT